MFLTKIIALFASASVIYVNGAPVSGETTKPLLLRRDQLVLTDSIWTSTSSGVAIKVTPTVIDGVTLSASPITNSATPWVSLDGSGIPYAITPTVSDSSTVSASPTPTESDYPEATGVPPVLRCFGDRVPDEDSSTLGYPFCTALNGSEWLVGETYWITWDPTYWGSDDITRVKLQFVSYPIKDDEKPIMSTDYINNNNGYYPMEILSSYLLGASSRYFFLTISPLASPGTSAKHVGTKTGPLLRMISSKSDAITSINRVPSDNGIDSSSSSSTTKSKSKSDNNAKVIAPAVIVPVIVVLAVAFGVIYYIRTRKPTIEGVSNAIGGAIRLKRRSGYAEGSKAQRTGVRTQVVGSSSFETDNETDLNSVDTRDLASTVHTETNESLNPFRNG